MEQTRARPSPNKQTNKGREPLTSSGVSLVSGWLWAARRAMAPARMLLRLIWRSGGGPPRGWPRTMMAQPDKTWGEEDGEERQLLSESIHSKTDVATHRPQNQRSHVDGKKKRPSALGFFPHTPRSSQMVMKPDMSQASRRSKLDTRLNKS